MKFINTTDNGTSWYELKNGEVIGITESQRVLDCDGIPYPEGFEINEELEC